MSKRPFRLPSDDRTLLNLSAHGRAGALASRALTTRQVALIRRTVNRAPEVMVKVTGGGRKTRAVTEHLSYISHAGELELETDDGQRVPKSGQKDLLRDWHLELSAGQYRPARDGSRRAGIKLVHNIVLSMPAPTPADRVLGAAKNFAREKFALSHRYVLALHTHQKHPHVHLVVKAEGVDGRRLHIDKAMLREWRQDFARMMREQGIAANATPRAVRGQGKRGERDTLYRTRRRGTSRIARREFSGIIQELASTRTIRDPAHKKLVATRQAVIGGWTGIADVLEGQGKSKLARKVRDFVSTLPPVRTDRERVAERLIKHVKELRAARTHEDDRVRDQTLERTR